jgi:perosamine synthetase
LGTTARIPHPFEFDHDVVGFNYRMPNLNAALGCAQLQRLPELLVGQRELHDRYLAHFSDIDAVAVISQTPGRHSNYWLQAIRLSRGGQVLRDEVLRLGAELGIPLRPLWKPIPVLEAHRGEFHGKFASAAGIYDSVVCLPSSPKILSSLK